MADDDDADRYRVLTQEQLIEECKARFGDDPKGWAFKCPTCGDIACAQDFIDVGADPTRIGQECIGRYMGALKRRDDGQPVTDGGRSTATRGCDWTAYGLIPTGWVIEMPDRKRVHSFPLAPAVGR